MRSPSKVRNNSRFKDHEKIPSRRQAKRSEPTGIIVIAALITLLLVTGIYVVFLHAPSTESAYPPVIAIPTESGNTFGMNSVATSLMKQDAKPVDTIDLKLKKINIPTCPFDPVQGCDLDERIKYWKEPADCIRSPLYKSTQKFLLFSSVCDDSIIFTYFGKRR